MAEERTKCANQLNDFSKSKQVNDCYLASFINAWSYLILHAHVRVYKSLAWPTLAA